MKRNVSHRGISLVRDEFPPQFYYHYRGDISFPREGFRRTYLLQHVGCGNLFWVLREFFSWDFFVLNQGKQRGCQTCMNCTICQATHKRCLHHLKAYHLENYRCKYYLFGSLSRCYFKGPLYELKIFLSTKHGSKFPEKSHIRTSRTVFKRF